jgi:hypothetical protein
LPDPEGPNTTAAGALRFAAGVAAVGEAVTAGGDTGVGGDNGAGFEFVGSREAGRTVLTAFTPPAPAKLRVTVFTRPVDPAARSEITRVHVPFAFNPLNADSICSGRNVPAKGADPHATAP